MSISDEPSESPIEGNIDDISYTDEEIEDWIKRDRDFVRLSEWNAYILARRQAYLFERQKVLGSEYYSNPIQWDNILDREWRVMEERLNSGIGLDKDILEEFGVDFFTAKEDLFNEMEEMTESLDSEYVGESEKLLIYTFEDFLITFRYISVNTSNASPSMVVDSVFSLEILAFKSSQLFIFLKNPLFAKIGADG